MADLTEREKLEVKLRRTIEWNFGQIADAIDEFGTPCRKHDHPFCIECFKSLVRKFGNEAIRVTASHLEYCNISRNHRADQVNINRVAQRAREGE